MKANTLTETEERIIEMLHTVDILTEQMNAMVPVVVESMELDRWKELYNYREDIFLNLYNTVEAYIRQKGQEEDALECWKEVYYTLENCTKAIDIVIKLEDEERISLEEYKVISKPLKRELQNLQRFAVAKVLDKKREVDEEGGKQNPLSFLI